MNQFADNRRILWLGSVILIVLGILAAFVILPAMSPTETPPGAHIRVPKMENVPPDNAPKLKLETEKEK
jgi:hypothetical protein